MKSFREYCESEAPATVNDNVGKPDGGKVKKKPETPPGFEEDKRSFKDLFGNLFSDIFKDKRK